MSDETYLSATAFRCVISKMYIYIKYGDLFPNKRRVHKPHMCEFV